jgi:hypothetical protein
MKRRARRQSRGLTVAEQRSWIIEHFAMIEDPQELVALIEHCGITIGPDICKAAEDILAHYKTASGYDWLRACKDFRTFPPWSPAAERERLRRALQDDAAADAVLRELLSQ